MKYICTNCDYTTLRWEGKCSSCGEWGTLVQSEELEGAGITSKSKKSGNKVSPSSYTSLKDLSKIKEGKENTRIDTGLDEFNRVLGGGIVPGEVIIISGQPGIGKSTLLLQVALILASKIKVLYVSGEESLSQIKSRVDRVSNKFEKGNVSENLLLSTDIQVEKIEALVADVKPDLLIVDSIQTVESANSSSFPGSIGQVRICGAYLTRIAKSYGVPTIIVGQINKQGNIAGPKVLEHTVDCVLYLEGDEFNSHRILTSMKNRFGPTNEIGLFEMVEQGLAEVKDPSALFLQKGTAKVGSAITAVMRGSRVVFVEVQALVVERVNSDAYLKRVANGIKRARLDMLAAVLSKYGGVFLGDKDIFVNVVGGLNIEDPVVDLAVCAAIKSAVNENVLKGDTLFIGEVGLSGEIRGYFAVESILKEADRLGYKEVCLASGKSKAKMKTLKTTDISRISKLP